MLFTLTACTGIGEGRTVAGDERTGQDNAVCDFTRCCRGYDLQLLGTYVSGSLAGAKTKRSCWTGLDSDASRADDAWGRRRLEREAWVLTGFKMTTRWKRTSTLAGNDHD